MANFKQLTVASKDGQPVTVNLEKITFMLPVPAGTRINFTSGADETTCAITVTESMNDIMMMKPLRCF